MQTSIPFSAAEKMVPPHERLPYPGNGNLAYGSDLSALVSIAYSLEAYKKSPGSYISTSLILFSLALPAYMPEARIMLDSPAATAFSIALHDIAGDKFYDAWSRYFDIALGSVRFSIPRTNRSADFTENCREWLVAAGKFASKTGRTLVTIEDLIEAMVEQPNGRFNDVLGDMKVTVQRLFEEYGHRVLHGVSEITDERVYQHLVHDQADKNDLMDFKLYADAIASFLTSPVTKGPISISIQAPWGAGKSSLMHQVRHLLDPAYGMRAEGKPLTAQGALRFFNRLILPFPQRELRMQTLTGIPQEHRWTIWFNAWKYESSEQVWAGLVDAIVTQVTDRLPPDERELFLLRLNLSRIDDGLVRQKLYDRAAAYWWAGAKWILLFALAAPAVFVAMPALHAATFGGWLSGGLGLTLFGWLAKCWHKVKAEPATFSLAEYVRTPDYGKSTGVIHQIHQDLQRIVALLPVRVDDNGQTHGTAPLVIFIDDLDRCAPNKVASIVEGINTFLASDQREFMFVIGMDPQMVAASLEHAHKDVRQHLPSYEQNVPLGWRFMDKFIQLAFTIPPRRAVAIEGFVRSLTPERQPSRTGLLDDSPSAPPVSPEEGGPHGAASEPEQGSATRTTNRKAIEHRGSEKESEEVYRMVAAIASEFVFSPREIKRILNFVRFVLLLRQARIDDGQRVPELAAYRRWIVLCIRWPDMVRWLQWGADTPPPSVTVPGIQGLTAQRLYLIEQAASPSADGFQAWSDTAAEGIGLPPRQVRWLADPDLHRFFVKEVDRTDVDRLSYAASIGFY